jgi:hypothetical protein
LEIGEARIVEEKDENGEEKNFLVYFLLPIPEFERLLKIRRKISATKIAN